MQDLTFDTLNQGWNMIRTSGAASIRKVIPGLIDPAQIMMQRSEETPQTMTVVFTGFEQALDNPEQESPILKRLIMAWVKNFASVVQIEKTGDTQSFILRIMKPQNPAQVAENKMWQEIAEAIEAGAPKRKLTKKPLAHIVNVRNNNGW